MKDKILTFIIGLLMGAIIATIAFSCYSKSNTNTEFTKGDRPAMFDQNGNGGGGTPPDRPNENSGPGGNRDGNTMQDKFDENSNSTGTKDENTVPEKPAENSNSNKTSNDNV